MFGLWHRVDDEADVKIVFDAPTPKEAEYEVDGAIDEFDHFFRTIQSDHTGLTRYERAAIKTFLRYHFTHQTRETPHVRPENRG